MGWGNKGGKKGGYLGGIVHYRGPFDVDIDEEKWVKCNCGDKFAKCPYEGSFTHPGRAKGNFLHSYIFLPILTLFL